MLANCTKISVCPSPSSGYVDSSSARPLLISFACSLRPSDSDRNVRPRVSTYPTHLEISQHTSSLTTQYTPVANLRRSGIAVHLCQLQLGLCPRPCRKRLVTDDVSECLSVSFIPLASSSRSSFPGPGRGSARVDAHAPLCLGRLKGLSLGVVADGLDVEEAAQIELLGAEGRHCDGCCG